MYYSNDVLCIGTLSAHCRLLSALNVAAKPLRKQITAECTVDLCPTSAEFHCEQLNVKSSESWNTEAHVCVLNVFCFWRDFPVTFQPFGVQWKFCFCKKPVQAPCENGFDSKKSTFIDVSDLRIDTDRCYTHVSTWICVVTCQPEVVHSILSFCFYSVSVSCVTIINNNNNCWARIEKSISWYFT